MIGVLDPTLLATRSEREVVRDLEAVLRACIEHNIELTPLTEYWPALWDEFGSSLEKQLSPAARRTIQTLRHRAPKADTHVAPLQPNGAFAWRQGFNVLFGAPVLQAPWADRMALAVIRAVASGNETVVFCRRVLGRNLQVHRTENCTLHENTRWILHVQPKGTGARQVLCVYHPRNIRERWTTRFDWRLPSVSDGARYPFCVPPDWWKKATIAFRTISAKPAWLDAHGNGWARPNINGGAGHHWDVFIDGTQTRNAIGLDQVNIVEFGAPPNEGTAGSIHHVPTAKKAALKDVGWSC